MPEAGFSSPAGSCRERAIRNKIDRLIIGALQAREAPRVVLGSKTARHGTMRGRTAGLRPLLAWVAPQKNDPNYAGPQPATQ
eukprot:296490-Pyramimonas_sp.AAC.1